MDKFRIYCDETWNTRKRDVLSPYYVFYGVFLNQMIENEIIQDIRDFRFRRGLEYEIKWTKVEKEWKTQHKSQKPNRYEDYLSCVLLKHLTSKQLSFGCMYLPKAEYDRVEPEFLVAKGGGKLDFFFMLYYQFLIHCFIKNQAANKPVEIFIDNRNLGSSGSEFNLNNFRRRLNAKQVMLQNWRYQPLLEEKWRERLQNAVTFVALTDSKRSELIQLADLTAGCFRYILENKIGPPANRDQGLLFESAPPRPLVNGRDHLCDYFYSRLREISGYENLNLATDYSRHYRFNIFPFEFRTRKTYPGQPKAVFPGFS